jgi:hypothetical protein
VLIREIHRTGAQTLVGCPATTEASHRAFGSFANMTGWSIVSQMMNHITFIAFFLSNQKRVINMNLSSKLVIVIGKMQ